MSWAASCRPRMARISSRLPLSGKISRARPEKAPVKSCRTATRLGLPGLVSVSTAISGAKISHVGTIVGSDARPSRRREGAVHDTKGEVKITYHACRRGSLCTPPSSFAPGLFPDCSSPAFWRWIVLPVPIPPLCRFCAGFRIVRLFGLPGKRKDANGRVKWNWN